MQLYSSADYPLSIPNGTGVIVVSEGHYIVPCVNAPRFDSAYGSRVSGEVFKVDRALNLFIEYLMCVECRLAEDGYVNYTNFLEKMTAEFPFLTTARIFNLLTRGIKDNKVELVKRPIPPNHLMDLFAGEEKKEDFYFKVSSEDVIESGIQKYNFLHLCSQGNFMKGHQELDKEFLDLFGISSYNGFYFILNPEFIVSLFHKNRKLGSFDHYVDLLIYDLHKQYHNILPDLSEYQVHRLTLDMSKYEKSLYSYQTGLISFLGDNLKTYVEREVSKILSIVETSGEPMLVVEVSNLVTFSSVVFQLEEIHGIKLETINEVRGAISIKNPRVSEIGLDTLLQKVIEWLVDLRDKKISRETTFKQHSGLYLTAIQANHFINISKDIVTKVGLHLKDSHICVTHITGVSGQSPDLKLETNPFSHFSY